MKPCARSKPLKLSKYQPLVAIAPALCVAALISVTNAGEANPPTPSPRPLGVKPHLSFSPNLVELCVTPAVTLECTTKSRNTLESRRPGRNHDNKMDTLKITSITIFKMGQKDGVGEDGWDIYAELGISGTPTGFALDNPKVKVFGKVGGSARESYLRVVWDTADEDTFSVFRCDVIASQPGSRSEVISTEPLQLDPAVNGSNGESQLLSVIQELKDHRLEDIEWRKSVDAKLDQIIKSTQILDHFARGNSWRLNKIISKMNELSTTTSTTATTPATTTTTTTTTATTTPASTVRTFAPPTGDWNATKDFVKLGFSGLKPWSTGSVPSTPEPTSERPRKRKQKSGKRRRKKKKMRKSGGRSAD